MEVMIRSTSFEPGHSHQLVDDHHLRAVFTTARGGVSMEIYRVEQTGDYRVCIGSAVLDEDVDMSFSHFLSLVHELSTVRKFEFPCEHLNMKLQRFATNLEQRDAGRPDCFTDATDSTYWYDHESGVMPTIHAFYCPECKRHFKAVRAGREHGDHEGELYPGEPITAWDFSWQYMLQVMRSLDDSMPEIEGMPWYPGTPDLTQVIEQLGNVHEVEEL